MPLDLALTDGLQLVAQGDDGGHDVEPLEPLPSPPAEPPKT